MANVFTASPEVLDWEEGDESDADATPTSGTGVVDALDTYAYDGTYSLRAIITSGASGDFALGRKSITWPGGDVVFYRFFLYIEDLGTNGYDTGLCLGGLTRGDNVGSGIVDCTVHIDCAATDIEIRARDGAGNQVCALDTALNRDQWYEIEVKYDISGANAAVELWVDNVSQGTWAGSGVPGADPDRLVFGAGAYNFEATINGDVYIDNVQCGDARIGGAAANAMPMAADHFARRRN